MRRSLISLLVGIVMAILAVVLVRYYESQRVLRSAENTGDKMVRIVVASQDLPFGSNIRRDYIEYAEWPERSVPTGAIRDMEVLVNDREGKGHRVTLHPLYKGEPLLQQEVSGFGDKATLSRRISAGKRAFSIRVNEVSGVAGFLVPGDHVDVILTQKAPGDSSHLDSTVLLQHAIILAVDQLTDEKRDKPTLARTITLEVTTQDAQKLALAQQIGNLSLMLRGYANNEMLPSERSHVGDLVEMAQGQHALLPYEHGEKEGVGHEIAIFPHAPAGETAACPDKGDVSGPSPKNIIRIRRGMVVDSATVDQ